MNVRVSPASAFAIAAVGIGMISVMEAVMKSLVLAIGVYNAMLWRSTFGLPLGFAAWRIGGGISPSRRALRLHALRGTVSVAMAMLFFWGLGRVPMAQAITLSYLAPILALLLAAAVLGERVGKRVLVASLAAFGGVLIVIAGPGLAFDGQSLAGPGAILASAVLYAINLVVARRQSQVAKPGEITFFQSTMVVLWLVLAAPWLIALPDAAQLPKLVAGAVLTIAGIGLLAWAYAHGNTGFLAMSEYTSFIYAAMLGWLVFGETLSLYTIAGAAMIVAACVYAAWRRDISAAMLEPAT